MKRTLVMLLIAIPCHADSMKDATRWLDAQVRPHPEGVILQSYETGNRSYTYDAAVSVIAFCKLGKTEDARGILLTLEKLIGSDHAVGFSFSGEDYDRDLIRSGTVAWVGYAVCYYQASSGDDRFLPVARKLAGYLLRNRVLDRDDRRYGLVKAGSSNGMIADWAAVEHQIDAWFFLRELGRLTHDDEYLRASDLIRRSLLERMWNEKEGRFHLALHKTHRNDEKALDASAWGALFLIAAGEPEKAERAMKFAEAAFSSNDAGVSGYRPYAGEIGDYPGTDWNCVPMVWGEGSLGMALAYHRLGQHDKAKKILAEIGKMRRGGGVLYATRELPDFCALPSAASTGWFIIAADEMSNSGAGFWM